MHTAAFSFSCSGTAPTEEEETANIIINITDANVVVFLAIFFHSTGRQEMRKEEELYLLILTT